MPSTVKMHLDQLSCIAEDDGSGASEPYLFVTYFWVDGRNIATPQPVSTMTPVYNAYRTEMPNGVRAGTVITVPPFLASAEFEVDPGPLNFMLAGVIVLVLEEDESPLSAVLAGRNAYLSGVHEALNDLVKARIQNLDTSAVTPEEVKAIADAVKGAVVDAIASRLSIWQKLFDDQDDLIGYTHVAFIGPEIQTRPLVFPAVANGAANRYALTGTMTVQPSQSNPTTDLCAGPRQALRAKEDEIRGLQLQRQHLQQELVHAPTNQKAALVRMIVALGERITALEAELPALQAALKACQDRFTIVDHPDVVVIR